MRDVGRNVQGQARLAHPRPAGNDDQVARLETVRHAIEVDEAGAQAGEVVRRLLFELLDCLAVNLVERHEGSRHRLLTQLHHGLLRAVQGVSRLETAVERRPVDRRAGIDQAPAQGPFLDDLDVGVDPAEVGQIHLQRGQIRHPAGGVELASLLQPRLYRPEVDRAVRLLKREHRLVQQSMPLEVVVLRLQAGRGGRQVPVGVEQNRGQHRALRLLAVRQTVCFLDRRAHDAPSLAPSGAAARPVAPANFRQAVRRWAGAGGWVESRWHCP